MPKNWPSKNLKILLKNLSESKRKIHAKMSSSEAGWKSIVINAFYDKDQLRVHPDLIGLGLHSLSS